MKKILYDISGGHYLPSSGIRKFTLLVLRFYTVVVKYENDDIRDIYLIVTEAGSTIGYIAVS